MLSATFSTQSREAAHELPVVVGQAVGEVEVAVRGDGPDRAGRHAQLAFEAGVVGDGLAVGRRLGVDQYRAKDDEVAELGVDDVAVDAHVTQARRHGHRLVRDDPNLAGEAVLLHRKARRRVHGPDALLFQGGDDLAGDLVGMVVGAVKLQIRGGTGWTADRLSIHPADEAEERLGSAGSNAGCRPAGCPEPGG